MATNVPSSLVNWLLSFGNDDSLLIHLSTDQVYEGVKSFYKEEDETLPVNMYGRSKVAAEKFIVEKCSNYAILRSSIIYGPQTISPVGKSLPIQWMDSVLSQGQQVEFFNDEFRCPVYVKDMVDVILSLAKTWLSGVFGLRNHPILTEVVHYESIPSSNYLVRNGLVMDQLIPFCKPNRRVRTEKMMDKLIPQTKHPITCSTSDGKKVQVLLNVGGPDRVSRLQMADSVATVRGYNHSIIKSVSASSVNRGVASPSDISMDITKLTQMLSIKPISFQDGVRATLDAEANS